MYTSNYLTPRPQNLSIFWLFKMSVTGTSKFCAQIEISDATPTKFANKTRQTKTMNCILQGNRSVGTFGYFLATLKC